MQAPQQTDVIQDTDDVTVLANRPGTWILAFTPLDSVEPPIHLKVFTPGASKPHPLDRSSAAAAPFEPTHTPAKPPAPEDSLGKTPSLPVAPEHGMNTAPPLSPAPESSSSAKSPPSPAHDNVSDAASPPVYVRCTPKKGRRHIWDGNAAYTGGGFAQDPRNGGPGGRAYSSYSEGSAGLHSSDAPGSPDATTGALSSPPLPAPFKPMASSSARMLKADPMQNPFDTHDAGSAPAGAPPRANVLSASSPPHPPNARKVRKRLSEPLASQAASKRARGLVSSPCVGPERLRDRVLESTPPEDGRRPKGFVRAA
ncbi:hypothetical protein BV25DRAFT_1919204 [Artomyces pyxidatus]|uniref:Uncharacterized protein n=1 Tax=Artomyces pyxidatus TaxID=48021 RepID=A0ACB8SQM4_9AGAM|nr:hypothetical protein BV25DRAFT_1919204 [Artomyces pyxidatus]